MAGTRRRSMCCKSVISVWLLLVVPLGGVAEAAPVASVTSYHNDVIARAMPSNAEHDSKYDVSGTVPYDKTLVADQVQDIYSTATTKFTSTVADGGLQFIADMTASGTLSGAGRSMDGGGQSVTMFTVATTSPYSMNGTVTVNAASTGPGTVGLNNEARAHGQFALYRTNPLSVVSTGTIESIANDRGLQGGPVNGPLTAIGELTPGTYRLEIGAVCSSYVNQTGTGSCSTDTEATFVLGAPANTIDIANVNSSEGNSLLNPFNFTVALSSPATAPVSVHYDTVEVTADEGTDYAGASDVVTFDVGEQSHQVTIGVAGDRKREPDETFRVILSDATGADIGDGLGRGTIVNDDACDNLYTSGDNTITGTAGNDVLCGGGGNDDIDGRGGNDRILGGAGLDLLNGAGGRDTIEGGTSHDVIFGGDGEDTLRGGDGPDTIHGEAGPDVIHGDGENDRLRGGPGSDTLRGGAGTDEIFGGDHADDITGDGSSGGAKDVIRGEAGNDTIAGNTGNDTIIGGPGDDVATGGNGEDTMSGNLGDDGLDGNDGPDALFGDEGRDTLRGGAGGDDLSGGDHADTIRACDNTKDTVTGGSGNDVGYIDLAHDDRHGIETEHGC